MIDSLLLDHDWVSNENYRFFPDTNCEYSDQNMKETIDSYRYGLLGNNQTVFYRGTLI